MVRLDNCHRCRAEPFEATIYSLEATDKALELFKGNFQAALTIEVEETSTQQSQEKQERMELPLNFSRTDAFKVRLPTNELTLSKISVTRCHTVKSGNISGCGDDIKRFLTIFVNFFSALEYSWIWRWE